MFLSIRDLEMEGKRYVVLKLDFKQFFVWFHNRLGGFVTRKHSMAALVNGNRFIGIL